MRTNRTRNGFVFSFVEFAWTACQPMIFAKGLPRDDHHHYRL